MMYVKVTKAKQSVCFGLVTQWRINLIFVLDWDRPRATLDAAVPVATSTVDRPACRPSHPSARPSSADVS